MITPWVENGAIIRCQNDIAVKGIWKNFLRRHQGFTSTAEQCLQKPVLDLRQSSHKAHEPCDYRIRDGHLTLLAQHDVTRFGDYFTSTTGTLTKDEESSGVIEITSLLARADGKKYFFLTTQNHAADTSANSAELVEGGN